MVLCKSFWSLSLPLNNKLIQRCTQFSHLNRYQISKTDSLQTWRNIFLLTKPGSKRPLTIISIAFIRSKWTVKLEPTDHSHWITVFNVLTQSQITYGFRATSFSTCIYDRGSTSNHHVSHTIECFKFRLWYSKLKTLHFQYVKRKVCTFVTSC